jgi:hypothetical protein
VISVSIGKLRGILVWDSWDWYYLRVFMQMIIGGLDMGKGEGQCLDLGPFDPMYSIFRLIFLSGSFG